MLLPNSRVTFLLNKASGTFDLDSTLSFDLCIFKHIEAIQWKSSEPPETTHPRNFDSFSSLKTLYIVRLCANLGVEGRNRVILNPVRRRLTSHVTQSIVFERKFSDSQQTKNFRIKQIPIKYIRIYKLISHSAYFKMKIKISIWMILFERHYYSSKIVN